jgi:hypothetical protein
MKDIEIDFYITEEKDYKNKCYSLKFRPYELCDIRGRTYYGDHYSKPSYYHINDNLPPCYHSCMLKFLKCSKDTLINSLNNNSNARIFDNRIYFKTIKDAKQGIKVLQSLMIAQNFISSDLNVVKFKYKVYKYREIDGGLFQTLLEILDLRDPIEQLKEIETGII